MRRDLRRQRGQPDERRTADDDPLSDCDVTSDLHETRLAIAELDRPPFEALAGHLDEDDRLSRIVDDGTFGYRDCLGGRGHEDAQGDGLSDGEPPVWVGELVDDRNGAGIGIKHPANARRLDRCFLPRRDPGSTRIRWVYTSK